MSLKLTAQLPKGYEPRTMYLYVARTGRKWGFWFSDANWYSVRALIDGTPMTDHFTTRFAAVEWAEGQRWQVWPRSVTRGVPHMIDSHGWGTAATRASVTTLWVEARI